MENIQDLELVAEIHESASAYAPQRISRDISEQWNLIDHGNAAVPLRDLIRIS